MVEVEAPPAAAEVPAETQPGISPAEAPAPASFPALVRARLRRLAPEVLVRRWRTFAGWSHTRTAIILGTGALGLVAFFAAAALIAIGVFGAGTQAAPGLADLSNPLGQPGPTLPSDANALFGPLVTSPQTRVVVGEALSGFVVQQTDLPRGLVSQESGATGLDPTSGLIGSYHVVFQPAVIAGGTTPSDTGQQTSATPLVVFSEADAYEDVDSATAALGDSDVQQLGLEAGLPQLVSESAAAPTVGDASRALYLHGSTGTTDIAVYVILFRNGPMVGVVGAAWPRGQESLSTAISLAQAQNSRIAAGRSITPGSVPDPGSLP